MKTRKPAITFYLNGKIDIAKQIVRALHLTPGDVVDITTFNGETIIYRKIRGQDTENEHKNVCRETHRHIRTPGTLRLWSTILARRFLHGERCKAFPVGPAVDTPYGKAMPIITCFPITHD